MWVGLNESCGQNVEQIGERSYFEFALSACALARAFGFFQVEWNERCKTWRVDSAYEALKVAIKLGEKMRETMEQENEC